MAGPDYLRRLRVSGGFNNHEVLIGIGRDFLKGIDVARGDL